MQKNLCQKSFSKYYFFIVYIIINIYSFETNALPLKTKILNLKEETVGLAHIYIDYVELLGKDETPKGRLSFANMRGLFHIYIVLDDGKQNIVGLAKNRQIFDNKNTLVGHYDWTTFWSYVYSPSGKKLGKAKCIAFRGICAAGIASYLTGLLEN